MEVHNTGIKQKEENWQRFADLIGNQFKHGGDKYSFNGRTDKEFTDFVCELAPGKTGFDWIFQTQLKYMGRFMNFNREKDLLKIATYCYIAWLKGGFHLNQEHDEDTKADGGYSEKVTLKANKAFDSLDITVIGSEKEALDKQETWQQQRYRKFAEGEGEESAS